MATSFAALVYRPAEISDAALSQGFAVALAGWDVPAPSLQVAKLAGVPGHEVAFYTSGAGPVRGAEDEAFELSCELFEDDLPPALAVLDRALEEGRDGARVYAITYADGILHDDAWRFDKNGFERRFVREGDLGPEAGRETAEGADDIEVRLPDDDDPDKALARAARPLRGSTFLSSELGTPALAALMGALFAVERRVAVRLADPGPDALAAEVARLCQALRRVEGRGASPPPAAVAGRATPAIYEVFTRTYDWQDPSDPQDLYRELSLGAIEGTLRFLRPADLARLDADAAWKRAAGEGLFPIARLTGSALGGGGKEALVALARPTSDEDGLVIVRSGARAKEAGPTFAELVRYLALGWSARSEAEEDMIGALMLRARIRCDR